MTARPPNIGLHRTRLRQGYGAAQASACLLRAARYDALRGLAADESADSSAEAHDADFRLPSPRGCGWPQAG